MNSIGDHVDIGGYLLNDLTPDQRQEVETHLAGCAECRDEVDSLREWTEALEAVPEAMLLDGPPEGGDLLLQRTVRQVRAETSGRRHRQTTLVGAAAAVALVAAIAGGVALGRGTAPATQPQALPSAATTTNPPGTKIASATDAQTGARISVAVLPAAGWVRVNATVSGVPAGEQCRLEVVGKDGTRILAGSWLVSAEGAAHGTTLNGSALIAPDQVASVRVVTTAGKEYAGVDV
jgi:hypothetical protein